MKFMDLFDIESTVRVCDIISLFLIGGDDKIYLNLANPNEEECSSEPGLAILH